MFILYDDGDFAQKKWQYPTPLSNPSNQRFGDQGGTDLDFIRNDQGADKQFEYFVPDTAHGLTHAGLARLNQSIEPIVYCIRGAQVNVCGSILGDGGRAKEAQREFLILLRDAIRTPDLSKNVPALPAGGGRGKGSFGSCSGAGTWLTPSRMVLNTGSVVGYNNKLKQTGPGMKLGVNNDVSQGRKKPALHLMAGGASKVKSPNSHPSNPIHKAAIEAQNTGTKTRNPPPIRSTPLNSRKKEDSHPETGIEESVPSAVSRNEAHDENKIIIAVGAVVIAGVLILSMRN